MKNSVESNEWGGLFFKKILWNRWAKELEDHLSGLFGIKGHRWTGALWGDQQLHRHGDIWSTFKVLKVCQTNKGEDGHQGTRDLGFEGRVNN